VKRRKVLFTATARRHILRERDWWLTNRGHVDAFASDLDREEVVAMLLEDGEPKLEGEFVGTQTVKVA
jgi:hypothetical protein